MNQQIRDALAFYADPKSYVSGHNGPDVMRDGGVKAKEALEAVEAPDEASPQDALFNPAHQVFFRAGLIACREYMARFVEATNPVTAMSIRANWWPALGPDLGPPRQLDFKELTEGEYGTESFHCKTKEEISPTLEALPVALRFLEHAQAPSAQIEGHGVKEPQR